MNRVRRPEFRILMVDGLLAVLLGIGIVLISRLAASGQVPPRHPLDLLGYALVLIAVGAVAVRRLWPLVTLALAVGSIAVYLAFEYPYGPIFVTGLIASYTVAVRLPPLRSLAVCAAALVLVLVGHLPELSWERLAVDGPAMALGATALVGIPWGIGSVMRLYRESEARSYEQRAGQRAYDERLRVVQEVHDVVGHGLSAINLQSGIALHVLDKRPDQARPALEAIRQTSKDALDELRGTLAVFRGPEDSSGDRGPAPGLAQLDILVERMRQAGLAVETSMTGTPEEVPSAVDLAAYRIVQESLTNVLRHAGPATAAVRITYASGKVDLDITDTGGARMAHETSAGTPATAGYGILGMRERAAAVGGVLEAGPRPEGGFRVHAHLPFGKTSGE